MSKTNDESSSRESSHESISSHDSEDEPITSPTSSSTSQDNSIDEDIDITMNENLKKKKKKKKLNKKLKNTQIQIQNNNNNISKKPLKEANLHLEPNVLQHKTDCKSLKIFMSNLNNDIKLSLNELINMANEKNGSNYDLMIGFIELNGLIFVNEWLQQAIDRKDNDFIINILTFLNNDNLNITFDKIEESNIGKTIHSILHSETSKKKKKSLKLPTKIKLGSKKSSKNTKIDNNNNDITKDDKLDNNNITSKNNGVGDKKILLCNEIMTKYRKLINVHKKEIRKEYKRRLSFRDEMKNNDNKNIADCIEFNLNNPPQKISFDVDYFKRQKMEPDIDWFKPQKIDILIKNSNDEIINMKPIETRECKIEQERENNELEEDCFDGDTLDEPKILKDQIIKCNELPSEPISIIVDDDIEKETSPTPILPPPLNNIINEPNNASFIQQHIMRLPPPPNHHQLYGHPPNHHNIPQPYPYPPPPHNYYNNNRPPPHHMFNNGRNNQFNNNNNRHVNNMYNNNRPTIINNNHGNMYNGFGYNNNVNNNNNNNNEPPRKRQKMDNNNNNNNNMVVNNNKNNGNNINNNNGMDSRTRKVYINA